jgi:hypothetical protein
MSQRSSAAAAAAARVPFKLEQTGLVHKKNFQTQSFADGQLFAFSTSKAIPPSKHELLLKMRLTGQFNHREICSINAKFNKLDGRQFRMKPICSHKTTAPTALPTPAPTPVPTNLAVHSAHSGLSVKPPAALIEKDREMLVKKIDQIDGKAHIGEEILAHPHPIP